MIFKPKGFFLNLDKDADAKPAVVAPVAAKPAKRAKAEPVAAVTAPAGADAPAATSSSSAASAAAAPALTTAEAIAAELRREQENRPAPSVVAGTRCRSQTWNMGTVPAMLTPMVAGRPATSDETRAAVAITT